MSTIHSRRVYSRQLASARSCACAPGSQVLAFSHSVGMDTPSEINPGMDTPQASTKDDSSTRHLLDLGADTLQLILASLDEKSLLDVGGACSALRSSAQSPALWKAALLRFFDGEVPPELEDCKDAQAALRGQVEFARALTAREREARAFQMPSLPFPGDKQWMEELDARVAEVQMSKGNPHARPGCPVYYGYSGGAYSEDTVCYGQFAKATHTNSTACAIFGEKEGTRVLWRRLGDDQLKSGVADCDYGPLREWVDGKLVELAAAAGSARLAERFASERDAAAKSGFYRSTNGGPDINPSKKPGRSIAGRLSVPRVLAGVYSGLFAAGVTGTSIGSIYSIDCVDETTCADYSCM